MTIEEQRLAEMLHRVTPEPPRTVTVEDIAIRLANAGTGSSHRSSRRAASPGAASPRAAGHPSDTRPYSFGRRGRRWSPLLAAAGVVVVIAASTTVAVALTSHHSPSSPTAGLTSSPTVAQSSPGTQPTTTSSSPAGPTGPATQPVAIANGPWGAELIDSDQLTPGTLVGSGNSLYAISVGHLLRIDAKSGVIAESVQFPAPIAGQPPVVDGSTVWVVSSYGAGTVELRGFNAQTLAQTGSVTVSSSGSLATEPEGILAAVPDGDLYVAAGNAVKLVSPSSGSVVRQIAVSNGPADSVAVTPDGSTLYVGTAGAVNFGLDMYNAATGVRQGLNSQIADQPGNLVATSGGAYGTIGVGMVEEVMFFPVGNVSNDRQVGGPVSGGSVVVPTYADGTVWIGGTRQLACLGAVSAQVQNTAPIPAVDSVPDQIGTVAHADGNDYAIFYNPHTQQAGVAKITPPTTC